MGIGSNAARFLKEEGDKHPFSGSVLTLGVQDLSFNTRRLQEIFGKNVEKDHRQRATDHQLFKLLGFSEIIRSDFSDFEGAELLFDLNTADGPPAKYHGYFDCVIDGGTMEHVFHVPNALKNIIEFTKIGGRIIHMSPTNNYVDHGFYGFSPTLFHDFYTENGFTIEKCLFIRHSRRVEHGQWIAGDYSPGSLNHVSYGGLDDNMYATFFVATKTANSTYNKVPQQSSYRHQWAEGVTGAGDEHSKSFAHKLRKKAKRLEGRLRRRLGMVPFPINPSRR